MSEELQLKNSGLKATLPRLKILEIVRSSAAHLSAEDIYRGLMAVNANVGLGTVYRVLVHLEHAGLIKRNDFNGHKAVYEINEGIEHDHLVCIDCGAVEEFHNAIIEQQQQLVAQSKGYVLTEHKLTLYGRCGDCVGADSDGMAWRELRANASTWSHRN